MAEDGAPKKKVQLTFAGFAADIMFGAPGDWVYLYAAGLTQTQDSIGFSHAMFVPPPKLLEAAASGISFVNVTNATISEPLRWGSASKQVLQATHHHFCLTISLQKYSFARRC